MVSGKKVEVSLEEKAGSVEQKVGIPVKTI